MKSYTDIEQSKVLAEILPLESADYHYIAQGEKSYFYPYFLSSDAVKDYDEEIKYIPCWSLGALISLLPKRYCLETLDNGTYVCYNFLSQYEKFGKTPIDAVYSMIVFLKEEKII